MMYPFQGGLLAKQRDDELAHFQRVLNRFRPNGGLTDAETRHWSEGDVSPRQPQAASAPPELVNIVISLLQVVKTGEEERAKLKQKVLEQQEAINDLRVYFRGLADHVNAQPPNENVIRPTLLGVAITLVGTVAFSWLGFWFFWVA